MIGPAIYSPPMKFMAFARTFRERESERIAGGCSGGMWNGRELRERILLQRSNRGRRVERTTKKLLLKTKNSHFKAHPTPSFARRPSSLELQAGGENGESLPCVQLPNRAAVFGSARLFTVDCAPPLVNDQR